MSKPLRIAFMGTPEFAVSAFRSIAASGHDLVCAYTRPPRPKGRGQAMQDSPIHRAALEKGIPVRTPASLRKDPAAQEAFAALNLDVAVVAAYGLLLPKAVLEAPRYGCLNIHASLLPRWRGASPIQHAVLSGDEKTGISIMQMNEGLDTGPVILDKAVCIREQTTAASLHDELSALGSGMIVDVLDRLAADGFLDSDPQDDSLATYAPILTKEDGRIDWKGRTAIEIVRQIRAFNPWPGVWTFTGKQAKRLKVLDASVAEERVSEEPGTLIDRSGLVACAQGTALRLLAIQPENARRMPCESAINGGHLETGRKLKARPSFVRESGSI